MKKRIYILKKAALWECCICVIVNACLLLVVKGVNHSFNSLDEVYSQISTEVVERREAASKHYLLENGSFLAVTYPFSVHEKKADGSWEEIDNSLKINGGAISNNNKHFMVSFPLDLGPKSSLMIENNRCSLKWTIELLSTNSNEAFEIGSSKAKVEKNTMKSKTPLDLQDINASVSYQRISPNIDLRYLLYGNSLKEELILQQSSSFAGYSMRIECDGLTANLIDDAYVVFKMQNKTMFVLQSPVMYDSNYEISTCVKVDINKTETGYSITYRPDMNWLNDSSREYPIIIDPTVSNTYFSSNYEDTYVLTDCSASSDRALFDYLRVGRRNDDGNILRYISYFRIKTLPTIPSGYEIVGSHLHLNASTAGNTSQPLQIRKVTESWNAPTINWANRPSSTLLEKKEIGYTEPSDYYYNYYSASLNNTVKSWYSSNNYGLCFNSGTSVAYDHSICIYSGDYSSSNLRPMLTIVYDNAPQKNTQINSIQGSYNSSYSRDNAADYATLYGEYDSLDGIWDTPSYYSTGHNLGSSYGNNCTNFVSQCLKAGGMIDLQGGGRTSYDAWYYDTLLWHYYATYTWGGASNFMYHWGANYFKPNNDYLMRSYSVTTYYKIEDALKDWNYIANTFQKGDIIQFVDLETHEAQHSAIIHDNSLNYAQHTYNAINLPLYETLVRLATNNTSNQTIVFYKIK